MQIKEFPYCCGAGILCDFGMGRDEKTLIKDIKNNLAYAHGGIIFGITNLEQIREGKLLMKCGFKKIKTFPNPNTGLSELTLWGYDRTNLPQKIRSKISAPFYRLFYFIIRFIDRRT